eukprot:159694-Pleurochrysis_carterae.AAC.1
MLAACKMLRVAMDPRRRRFAPHPLSTLLTAVLQARSSRLVLLTALAHIVEPHPTHRRDAAAASAFATRLIPFCLAAVRLPAIAAHARLDAGSARLGAALGLGRRARAWSAARVHLLNGREKARWRHELARR